MSNDNNGSLSRRSFIQLLGLLGASAGGLPLAALASTAMLKKAIPSSGEQIPVIGMGSSRTFDSGSDTESYARLTEVLQAFFDQF